MNYIQTEIEGVWIIEPKVFNDARGYFMEAFKEGEFRANIGNVHFVQDNESKSSFGVLRGLHYQKGEYSQAKLVRVIKGKVLDVAVDSAPVFPYIRQVRQRRVKRREQTAVLHTPAALPMAFWFSAKKQSSLIKWITAMPLRQKHPSASMTRP